MTHRSIAWTALRTPSVALSFRRALRYTDVSEVACRKGHCCPPALPINNVDFRAAARWGWLSVAGLFRRRRGERGAGTAGAQHRTSARGARFGGGGRRGRNSMRCGGARLRTQICRRRSGNSSAPATTPSTIRLGPRPRAWSSSGHGSLRCGQRPPADDAYIGGGTRSSGFSRLMEWKVCIIGGIALLRWGEPLTRDVDVTLLSGFGREDGFVAPFPEAGYRGRVTGSTGLRTGTASCCSQWYAHRHRARRVAVRRGNGGTIQPVRVRTWVPVANLFGRGSRHPEALRIFARETCSM